MSLPDTISFLQNAASPSAAEFPKKQKFLNSPKDSLDKNIETVMPGKPASVQAEGRDRQVRSFVLRGGRLTEGQQRAMEELLPRYSTGSGSGFLDFAGLFGNVRPVVLEIGFGNGDATWQMAQQSPQENFIGVEVHKPGVGHLLLNLREKAIENVRIACEDAVVFLRERVTVSSLGGVRVFFPDPWPKKRHHKRRIVKAEFVTLLAEKVQTGGIVHFATDWQNYAEHMLEVLQQNPAFENLSDTGDYCSRPTWRPMTRYEKRGKRLGHEVYDLLFLRRS